MGPITIHPGRLGQFAHRSESFCLVTDPANAFDLSVATGDGTYAQTLLTPLEPGESLTHVLDDRVPEQCDVLVVAPGVFLTSPLPDQVGAHRRLSVLPCASTPVTPEQVEYFLRACADTDHAAIAARCEDIVATLEAADELAITDANHGSAATLSVSGDYEWNVQAGPIEPGEQQIAPNGELSASPLGIMDFDPDRRLDLDGTLALSGLVIVHRSKHDDEPAAQAAVYDDLAGIGSTPVVLTFEGGTVVSVAPSGPRAKAAGEALEELLAADPHYGIAWEFGLGLNPAVRPVPGNCGMNEVTGGRGATLHLGLGLTPTTRYALTFQCSGSTVTGAGRTVAEPTRRAVARRRHAACGCDEGARGA